jgi:hypothetical protein
MKQKKIPKIMGTKDGKKLPKEENSTEGRKSLKFKEFSGFSSFWGFF